MKPQSRIEKKTIQKMASLAMLSLTEREEELYQAQLEQIVEYISLLEKVNTEGVEPMVTAVEMPFTYREDTPRESSEQEKEDLLACAPDRVGPLYKVPPVL